MKRALIASAVLAVFVATLAGGGMAAPSASTQPTVLVQDDFDDGDFTDNPSWTDMSSQGCAPTVGSIGVDGGELHIHQSGAGGCGNAAQIQINLDVPLEGRQAVVSFDVMPIYSSVVGGTGQDNSEWPARVILQVEREGGDQKTLLIGYNYRGGFSQEKVWGYVVGFGNVPQGEWQRNQTFTLHNYIPDATRVLWILVGGAGWDYESRIDNISLMLGDYEPTATPTSTATTTPTATGTPPVTPPPTPTATPSGVRVGGVAQPLPVAESSVQQAGPPADGSGWSAAGYAALAGLGAVAAVAITAGGWYARRRWLR